MTVRTLVVCLAALILSACKINISVPQGGMVQTDTGLYACSEFEVCEITVDHLFFTERFQAVPRQGYRFAGWQKADGFLCGGREDACALTTTGMAANEDLLSVLYSDRDFYLSPVFEQLQTEPAGEPDVLVASKHRQINYEVSGDTPDVIIDSIVAPGNPTEQDGMFGFAFFSLQVAFSYGFSPQTCFFGDFELQPDYQSIMPQLVGLSEKPDALQGEWEGFYQRLVQYVAGFHEVTRNHVPVFKDRMRELDEWFYPSITIMDCEERLVSTLTAILDEEIAVLGELINTYDQRAGSTVYWGDTTVRGRGKSGRSTADRFKIRLDLVPELIEPQ